MRLKFTSDGNWIVYRDKDPDGKNRKAVFSVGSEPKRLGDLPYRRHTLKRDTAKLVHQMKKTKAPVVLTVNGKAELVVQDADSYQELLEARERIEAIEEIRRGLETMKRNAVVFEESAHADVHASSIEDAALVEASRQRWVRELRTAVSKQLRASPQDVSSGP